MYHELILYRLTPSHTIVVRIRQQQETDTYQAGRADCGAPWTHHTLDFEEEILHHIQENPLTSTQNLAHDMNDDCVKPVSV